VLAAGTDQFRLTCGLGGTRRVEGVLGTAELLDGGLPLDANPFHFGSKLARFQVEALLGLDGTLALGTGRLDGGVQRGDRVDNGVHVGAGPFDVLLDHLDGLLRPGVIFGSGFCDPGRGVATCLRLGNRLMSALERETFRLAPRLELLPFLIEFRDSRVEHSRLLLIECDLLLAPVDVQLPRMSLIADASGHRVGFGLLDPKCRERGLHFAQSGRSGRFAVARVGQTSACRLDRIGERAIAASEQHLLPSAHLVAQAGVAARLRGLTLQRAFLLLDFENDVIETRQIELGGLELQLCRAPARLVLGDPGGFFDQLATIGRPRTEDHSDLALLDDGVGFGAQPRVHQQFVNVLETALMAVDEVLALTRSEEAPRHFHVARNCTVAVGEDGVAVWLGRERALSVQGRLIAGIPVERRRHDDPAQFQPNFGGTCRFARVGSAEDDVFHLLAAQALGALFTKYPGERICDIALAAAIRAHDRRHPFIKGELGAIGEGFET
jgi:hypothetical protein